MGAVQTARLNGHVDVVVNTGAQANARAWIAHNAASGHDVYGYELGNEPGCYLPKVNLTALGAADDYAVLTQTIADVHAGGLCCACCAPCFTHPA